MAMRSGPQLADSGAYVGREDARLELSRRVLTISLALSLWIACGSFVLAMASLGTDPGRRVGVGSALVLAAAVALWRRDDVCVALRACPWLIVAVAVLTLGAALADGVDGPYVPVTETVIGVGAVVASPRTVWLCVAILDAGYGAAVLLARSPGDLAGVLGALFAYPFVAVVVLGLARLYKRFVANVDGILAAMRGGSPALTPALTRAVGLGGGEPPLLLLAPGPVTDLSREELRVVEGLANGMRPKELAFAWGVSLATVRRHIRLAKRKTGARTLPELAAITAGRDRRAAGPVR